ncbi:hypothetical protein [Moraxella cuniculi]|uniref:Probable hemoglobin and hemoglobin-haptoglobin-binding protein 1 n=1 Tax=Moraxella cuniculi TaxID=34061 RepID=A0A448GYV7_9GAMM|nr:hypothetical protein [Moraxella cuniculi]VEG13868.1 Probable hemoglobin and hemoglobin-haptoglobin-binding protein 1 precursor [Moraxella cuniculi]
MPHCLIKTGKNHSNKYLLSILVPVLMAQISQAYAEEVKQQPALHVQLPTGVVSTKKTLKRPVGQTVINDRQIARNMIADSRDLVKYQTGITVVEAGRFGSSGYANPWC